MLKENERVLVLEDISSNGRAKHLYAKRGEWVTIVSVFHLPVLIVEKNKERFPVRAEKVSKK